MSSSIQLIVGLANPGNEYADTRHNAGAWFVEDIARQENATLRFQAKYHGLHSQVSFEGHTCHLLIPTTYMNLSGQAVLACMKYYNIPTSSVLIAHDEIDLPVGTIKLKFDGGDGGHNGLKDVIRHLHTKQFYRLRVGVGRPGPESHLEVVDYVLKPPSKADRQKIDKCLHQAQQILPLILNGEMQKAMHKLHSDTEE